LNLSSRKPHSGGCREIYDYRFTIYDLKMRFEYSQFLWLLLVVPPALAAFFWWSERVKQKLLTQFVEPRLLAQLTVGLSPTKRRWKHILLISAVVLLIITIARPQRGFDLEEVQQNGLDIVVAVDTSKSMLATDIAPNRLARAKLAALELMQVAKADRLGLVAFAGDAFLPCPLTIDDTAFQQSVQALDVNSIPQGGTALAAAINTALATFKEKKSLQGAGAVHRRRGQRRRRARSGAKRGQGGLEDFHHRHRLGGRNAGDNSWRGWKHRLYPR
jgi:Ca-activated chloride channel family protein